MTAEHETPNWDRFDAYFERECSPEEGAAIERWMQADLANQAIADQFRILWRVRRRETPVAAGRDAAVERVMDVIHAHHVSAPGISVHRSRAYRGMARGWSVGRGVRAAAGVLLVVGGGYLAWRGISPRALTPALVTTAARDVATPRGERATLDLADGTRIILAPNSRLRIPSNYRASVTETRDIELDGEAYFSVHHDATRPFRVRTALGVAEDIGTEFMVSSYAESRGMRVVVASGSVAIRDTTRGASTAASPMIETGRPPLALLKAGDLARVDAFGIVSVRRGVDPRSYLAWTTGQLVFDGMPLRDALVVLSRWYDLEIRLDDAALGARPLTVTIDGQSARKVVEMLELLLHTRAEWRGRVVTLYAHPTAAAR